MCGNSGGYQGDETVDDLTETLKAQIRDYRTKKVNSFWMKNEHQNNQMVHLSRWFTYEIVTFQPVYGQEQKSFWA